MSFLSEVVVACCQYGPRVGELAYNRSKSQEMIEKAVQLGAQIIVLPELAQSGFNFKNQEEAYSLSEDLDGECISLWMRLARKYNIIVVGGYCENIGDDKVANSSVMIGPDGILANYQKAHLWDNEKNIFVPGNDVPPIIKTEYGTLSMMICYDLEFPEWVRIPALKGADILCAPVNWPDYFRPENERPNEMIRAQANASVNKMFLVVCDRCEEERGLNWVGGSCIINSDGFPEEYAYGNGNEMILVAKLDLLEARNKAISSNNNVHLDRRIDLY